MSYISNNNSEIQNLQAIAKGAYRTEEEKIAEGAVQSYKYRRSSIICLSTTIALVAIGGLAGLFVDWRLTFIALGAAAPTIAWGCLVGKYNHLKEAHDTKKQESREIIEKVATYLLDLRENKIKELLNESSLDSAIKREMEYDKKTNYQTVCDLAFKAMPVIEKHYNLPQYEPPGSINVYKETAYSKYSLYNFQRAVHQLASPKEMKLVIVMGKNGKLRKKATDNHPSHSVVATNKTHLMPDLICYITPSAYTETFTQADSEELITRVLRV